MKRIYKKCRACAKIKQHSKPLAASCDECGGGLVYWLEPGDEFGVFIDPAVLKGDPK